MTMKKYVALGAVTVLSLAGVLLAGWTMKKSVTEVDIYTVSPQLVEQTVTCSGKVESAESREVYADISCIAEQVLVKAGDRVNKGDVLFTVDVDATKQVLATAGGISPEMVPDGTVHKELTAPVSGIVTALNVSSGELTDAGKPCVVISSSEALQVKIAINEKNIRNLSLGQSASISGTAFTKPQYSGQVTYISSSARQQYVGNVSETVVDATITLSPAEVDESLRIGLSAKAKVTIGSTPDAMVVPYEYVLQDEDGREFVYLYREGSAVKQVIETGSELGIGFEVTKGLQAGDQVITQPEKITRDGTAVAIREQKG